MTPVSMKFRLVALNEPAVRASFDKLSSIARADNVLRSLVAGALESANAAKTLAPVKTSTLRRSIHVGGFSAMSPDFEAGSRKYSDIGGVKSGDGWASVLVGSNLVYARRVNYGFIGKDILGRSYHQGPNPYLTNGVEGSKEQAQAAMDFSFRTLMGPALVSG